MSGGSPFAGMNGRSAADATPSCGARCFTSNGRHLIQLDHPGMPPIPLAESDDLREAMGMALVAANSVLRGMGLSQVVRLHVIQDDKLLDD